jgi:hypothetical protein
MSATIPRTPIATPTPSPTFAPELSPPDELLLLVAVEEDVFCAVVELVVVATLVTLDEDVVKASANL